MRIARGIAFYLLAFCLLFADETRSSLVRSLLAPRNEPVSLQSFQKSISLGVNSMEATRFYGGTPWQDRPDSLEHWNGSWSSSPLTFGFALVDPIRQGDLSIQVGYREPGVLIRAEVNSLASIGREKKNYARNGFFVQNFFYQTQYKANSLEKGSGLIIGIQGVAGTLQREFLGLDWSAGLHGSWGMLISGGKRSSSLVYHNHMLVGGGSLGFQTELNQNMVWVSSLQLDALIHFEGIEDPFNLRWSSQLVWL